MSAENKQPGTDKTEPQPTAPAPAASVPARVRPNDMILAPLGATVGGVIGYFGFFWLAKQGFYGLALPGVLIGAGSYLLLRRRSLALGIICGIAAVALGIYSEWRFAPFTADRSFAYFLTHLYDLRPVTIILILLGAIFAF